MALSISPGRAKCGVDSWFSSPFQQPDTEKNYDRTRAEGAIRGGFRTAAAVAKNILLTVEHQGVKANSTNADLEVQSLAGRAHEIVTCIQRFSAMARGPVRCCQHISMVCRCPWLIGSKLHIRRKLIEILYMTSSFGGKLAGDKRLSDVEVRLSAKRFCPNPRPFSENSQHALHAILGLQQSVGLAPAGRPYHQVSLF